MGAGRARRYRNMNQYADRTGAAKLVKAVHQMGALLRGGSRAWSLPEEEFDRYHRPEKMIGFGMRKRSGYAFSAELKLLLGPLR